MAKAKKGKEKAKENLPDMPKGHPRTWTPEQRRDALLLTRPKIKSDYRLIKKDFQEELVPYGHLILDEVLGLRGIARKGRVTQIHGDEGAGKTTTTLWIAAQYQKATKEPIAIFEYEPAASDDYAYALGVDPENCFYERPTNLQDAIKRHVQLMEDAGVRFFVNDSIPYMRNKVARKDIESGKAFKGNYGSHAKGMAEFYQILSPYIMENDASLFVVNQTRDRIDDDADNANKWSYTNKLYSLPGGRAARFAPSVMLELLLETEVRPWEWGSKMPPEKEKFLLIQPRGAVANNFPTANRVRFRSLKNKVTGMGFRQGTVYIRPNFGPDENMSIRELACTYKLIEYSNPKWYIGKSEADAIATYPSKTELIEDIVIKENPEVMGKLKSMVKEAIAQDETERFKTTVTPEEYAAIDEDAARKAGTYDLDDEEEFVTKKEVATNGVTTLELED